MARMPKDEVFDLIEKRVMEHYKPQRVGYSGFDFDPGTMTKEDVEEFAKRLESKNPHIKAEVIEVDYQPGFHLRVSSLNTN